MPYLLNAWNAFNKYVRSLAIKYSYKLTEYNWVVEVSTLYVATSQYRLLVQVDNVNVYSLTLMLNVCSLNPNEY